MDFLNSIKTGLNLTPDLLSQFVEGIDSNLLKLRRLPNKWSVHEHACHIVDVQPMLIERIKRFKLENSPIFIPYLPTEDPDPNRLLEINLKEALGSFYGLRQEMLQEIEAIRSEDLLKEGSHPEYKKYTLEILLRHILLHDQFHMYRMEEYWISQDSFIG